MNKEIVIKKTEVFVKKTMKGDGSHDWLHIDRVRRNALYIASKEKADVFIVELGALLHDVGDYKFFGGREDMGGIISRKFLSRIGVDPSVIKRVCEIVDNVSFKGAKVKSKLKSLEGKVVQDADRLDALGAIGIARVFSFGGYRGLAMHDPSKKPNANQSKAAYIKTENTSINHFYEKLLLIKDRMHTKTAKKLAARKHLFMEVFLREFFREWKGSR